jgi:DNA-binding response OmpR family regulator
MHVLIIEDNADLAANIYDSLEAEGHVPDAAGDGITGLHLAVTGEYDVIVLDLMLPGLDGLSLCQKLREQNDAATPILMLTAKDTLDDKLRGFDAGADDYLIKPFAFQELEARLLALTRRHGRERARRPMRVGDLSFNPDTLEVQRGGRRLEPTPTGLKILELLIRNAPNVVSRKSLERALWGDDPPDSDALRAHIHMLRTTVDRPFDRPLIHTLHGIGFRLADTEEH